MNVSFKDHFINYGSLFLKQFACGNKLKSKTHNGNQIEQNNKSDNYLQANSNQKFTSSQSNSSEQSLVNSSCNLSNISRNSSNSSLKMNGYHHYNNHNNFHHNNNLDSSGDNQHSNSNHNQFNNFHYNHHYNHSNQHHYHHNSHHVHNSRMQPPPVMPSYSTHPFIPGHLNNGTIQPTVADHPYKMPYYAPQYTANSSKPFYPTNGPAHYTNTVLTSISPIATIAAPSITSNNGPPTIVTSNQMHTNCEQQTNGQQSTNVTTATIENVHTAPYSVTYPTNANAANSYMHPPPAQYIPAHPNAHHFTHHQPMFYVPLHLPQFYPPTHPHYPAPHHLAPQPAILTAPHQQLATPPISPQQDNGETCSNLDNSSNCDLTDLTDNDQHEEEEIILNGKEENATELNKENKDHQTITPTNTISNYNFLSPESMEEKQDTVEIKKDEEDQEEIENNDNELNENNKNTSSTNISSFSSVNELNTTNNDDEQSNDGQFDEILKTNQDKQLDDVQQISEDKIIEKIDENEEELKNKNKELNDNDEDLNVNNEEVNNLKVDSINLNNDNEKEDEFKNDEDKNGLIVKDEEEEKEEGDSTASSLNKPVTPRSWADLFKSNQMNFSKPKITIDNTSSTNLFNTDDFEPLGQQQIESIVKFTSKLQQTIKSVSIEEDEAFPRLSKKLKDLNLKHSLPLLVPRGFTNQSNWCYINSILQALLYCPPFYNLMREIGETQGVFREKSATPVFDSFAKFFTNFMPNEQLMRKVKQSNHFGYDDLPKLPPYEPKCIYNVLGNINNECLKGKQEDAEEFLSSVLNILHEEMLLLLNYDPKNGQQQVSKTKDEQQSQQTTKFITGQQSTDNDKSNSQDNGKLVWKEVKTKHKTLTANNVS